MHCEHPTQWKVNYLSTSLNQSTQENYLKCRIFNICDVFRIVGPLASLRNVRSTYGGVLLLFLKFASTLLKKTFLCRLFWRLVMTVMIPNCKTTIIISSTKFILEFVFLIYLYSNLLAPSMFSASLVCLYHTSDFKTQYDGRNRLQIYYIS